jgi:chorismate dehydratase
MLRIGQIDYLNVWPLFQWMQEGMPPDAPLQLVAGHPSELNVMLARSQVDLAPSSSLEYLLHSEKYMLLPGLSISSDGPVQSVLLASPFSLEQMPERTVRGLQVGLSAASASSVALLQVLWRFFWQWPEPEWVVLQPGQGLETGSPFLEIGDAALRLTCSCPPGWHLVDLGQAWREVTRLPFVFGVWMVRRNLSPDQDQSLRKVAEALHDARQAFARNPSRMITRLQRPAWLSLSALEEYWHCIRYSFGPREQAGLILFGEHIRQLGMIPSVPGLYWSDSAPPQT